MKTIHPEIPPFKLVPDGVYHAPELRLLDRDVVQALLTPGDVLQAVRQAFEHHGRGDGRLFPLVREPVGADGVFGIKSGDIARQGLLGMKVAGFWPANRARRKDAHQATILLVDQTTGRPQGLVDGNLVTTVRTGAAGGLGIDRLARAEVAACCVFGTGVQARSQVNFARRVRPGLVQLRYVTADGRADVDFEGYFAARFDVRHAPEADAAVSASDLVITATPSRSALFATSAVRPGTHINAVGADTEGKRELPEGLLARARLVVDDARQSRQVGEAQWARETPMTELGHLLTGHARFDRAPDDITIFDMTGLALQDLAVARMLLDKARTQGIGTCVPWPW